MRDEIGGAEGRKGFGYDRAAVSRHQSTQVIGVVLTVCVVGGHHSPFFADSFVM